LNRGHEGLDSNRSWKSLRGFFWVGEIVGVNNFNGRKGDDPFSGLLGAQYLVADTIVWDAGVAIGMSKAVPDFRLITGLTLLFKP